VWRGAREPRVLDVGTGSGAIALAVADEHPGARVTAVDSSPDAVALARENAERLQLDVDVRAGDFYVAADGWDLVVSNPPYVTPEEWDTLQPEIREWEPREALVGVGLHEQLARTAQTRFLVLESHECQARDVAATLTSVGYTDVRVTPDLAGKPRVVEGRR
jgi:release factor glutamine methyltransferase